MPIDEGMTPGRKRGEVCWLHQHLDGLRYLANGACVGCHANTSKKTRDKRRDELKKLRADVPRETEHPARRPGLLALAMRIQGEHPDWDDEQCITEAKHRVTDQNAECVSRGTEGADDGQ